MNSLIERLPASIQPAGDHFFNITVLSMVNKDSTEAIRKNKNE
jgi:hypothetical protein